MLDVAYVVTVRERRVHVATRRAARATVSPNMGLFDTFIKLGVDAARRRYDKADEEERRRLDKEEETERREMLAAADWVESLGVLLREIAGAAKGVG